MSRHKRKRPKHQRAGCLLCKPHKDERVGGTSSMQASVQRQVQPDENPSPARKSKKRNTLKYCRNSKGDHTPEWIDKGTWWEGFTRGNGEVVPRRWWATWVLACTKCHKHLGAQYGRGGPRVRTFPGSEKFVSGPPS